MDDSLLNRLSARARLRPGYLAYVLARYVSAGGPVTDALHGHLGLTPRDFQRLGLSLRPRADRFEEDVRATAKEFGIDPYRLAALIRFVDAVDTTDTADAADATADSDRPALRLPLPPQGAPGFLAAARERKTPPSATTDRPSEGET